MNLIGQTFTTGDWLALALVIVPMVAGLWRIASLLGSIQTELKDHARRLQVIETTQLEGVAAGKAKKHELED